MDLKALILALALAGLAGGVWGFLLAQGREARRRAAEAEEQRRRAARDRSEAERGMHELRAELIAIEERAKEQYEVFQILPELVRQMFSTGSRRNVGPLALRLMERLFDPEQSAIFDVRHRLEHGLLDDDFLTRAGERRLVLAAGRGLPPGLPQGLEVEVGKGPIGYVAEHRIAMDAADLAARSGLARRSLEHEVPGLRVDVAVPCEDEHGLIGVFCLGGVRKRQGLEKRLLRMVADLTGMATSHVTQMRLHEETANVDALTGVYNKRYLLRRLGDEVHRAEGDNAPVSLLILDIDHFKNYNDSNGHVEGDHVLKKVGGILKASIRSDDVAVRYGGEEFVIIYPGAPKETAARLAENLRRLVESHTFPHADTQPLGRVTISGGVATFPEDARSATDLIRCADQALYQAKHHGRNRIQQAASGYLT